MKRTFVIECDTKYSSAFVYEVEREPLGGSGDKYTYSRNVGSDAIFNAVPDRRFYGKLDVLLTTKEHLEKATPITPELPIKPIKEVTASDFDDSEEMVGKP